MRSVVGSFAGVKWQRLQLSDLFPHLRSGRWVYAIQDEDGRFTGDHWGTQKEMRADLDARAKANDEH